MTLPTNPNSGGPLACDGIESATQQGVQGLRRRCLGHQLGRKKTPNAAPNLPGNKTGTPAIAIDYCLT